MNSRKVLLGFTAMFGVALTAAMPASAQSDRALDVRHEGKIYHGRVCPAGGQSEVTCHARVVTDANGTPVEHHVTPNAVPAGFGPSDLRSAYSVTPTGSTRTIAIVDAYGYANAESDLATYRATFGLPACTTANGCFRKVNQNGQQGNYPRENTGWAQETALDLDMASAMCPSCHILLVQANSATLANLATAENTAVALGATIVSNSYGGGESGTTSYESAYNHAGVAITVSSGDSGYGVQFPAASPHVVAVGGTSLARSSGGRGWSETAWSGAGSGCSAVYAKPSWQSDGGCARRTVADVSAVADPATGVAVYGPTSRNRAAWLVFGGTSVAAPLIAGVYGNNGSPFETYPAAGLYARSSYLYDVTSGTNGSCGGAYLCVALPGYDGPTGLGTPNGITAFF